MTLSIRPAVESDMDRLCALARVIWQATYPALISQAQIDFKLADRYATTCIRAQLADPSHAWRLAWFEEEMIGFAHARIEASTCKLDKLYIQPIHQRRGVGEALLTDIKGFAREHAATRLWLQVNRGNAAALKAYQQYGFTVKEARVFDIGDGFVMDDFVMEAPL